MSEAMARRRSLRWTVVKAVCAAMVLTFRRYVRARLAEAGVGAFALELIDLREHRHLLGVELLFRSLVLHLGRGNPALGARIPRLEGMAAGVLAGQFRLFPGYAILPFALPILGLRSLQPKSPPCRGSPVVAQPASSHTLSSPAARLIASACRAVRRAWPADAATRSVVQSVRRSLSGDPRCADRPPTSASPLCERRSCPARNAPHGRLR